MILDLQNILIYLLILPLIGILSLLFLPSWNDILIKKISLIFSGISLVLSIFLLIFFNFSQSKFQFYFKYNWVPNFNFNFILGIDGISLFFILLTNLLIFLCVLISWNSIKHNLKLYFIMFFILNFFLIGVFCVLDLLLFYIFFESVLIPMYLIIGFWGSRARKIRAAYFFFLYTLLGSVLLLLSILYIYYQIGTTDFEILSTVSFTLKEQKILWLSFFASFATKIPMVPVHLWLPEAHVEAPTSGSVILAGILLKLGTYGFIRFLFPLFPQSCYYFSPLVYSIAAISIIYTSLTAIRQTDFKRIIAYTSIAHMNLVILGLFSFNVIGIEGALLQSLSHGFVASALFAIIGVVYDRYHTRTVKYYGGLVHIMPIYIIIFLFFTMANIGLPGTGSFVGEFLILTGSFQTNIFVTVIGATSMILGGCYSLWLFNRIAYGNLKTQYIKKFVDLNKKEFYIFLPFILGTLIMGLFPSIFLNPIHISVNLLIQLMQF
jgi:proton-translocating NADH-quinone oxidoreductase chain M